MRPLPDSEETMKLIQPFRALRADSDHAAQVAAPPYDVLDSDEARALGADNTASFLHVSKPEIDLPAGTDPYAAEVYAKGRENLDRLVRDGLLRREAAPCLYLYRQVMGDHAQVGLVAAVSVDAYLADRIKKHEHTRPAKEDDRLRHCRALNAHSGPVFLTYRHDAAIDALVAAMTSTPPTIDLTAADGVRHTLWVVESPAAIDGLVAAFEALPALYVADGHHRSAAAVRLCQERRAANPEFTGEEPFNRFLGVLFPDDQMQILPYHRVISDFGDPSPGEFLAGLRDRFGVSPSRVPVQPEEPGVFGLYVGGGWLRLALDPARIPADDPVGRLDVSLLADNCLAPLLGIHDPRTDPRIDFVGGIRGLAELERLVDSGRFVAAFALHPTRLDDLFAVADSGQVMPPKSTWFEPKLRDGLVILPLD
jgi:uncharacterized protein (DUF1015 family)